MARRIPGEEEIFHAARLIQAREERRRFLQKSCQGDEQLQARVEALLRVDDEEPNFLRSAAEGLRLAVDGAYPWEAPGTEVGPYRLQKPLREGGFGVVYLAEQLSPVRRQVALKMLKPGMDTRQVLARFEIERQALARMEHPNIARVFDAGATEKGRPYFVMEYIDGTPITEFCESNRLTVGERLELLITVCQAIQHAHHKGILHRDLKPANILVARVDGVPAPKVIDFGIAKALDQGLTDLPVVTQHDTRMGTLAYMSPEQTGGGASTLDTRSDVYSLGVLLYELLTGSTPFECEQLRDVARPELERRIREEVPPSPSARLGASGSLPELAAARGIDPGGLTRLVRGELDYITLQCLAKEPSRRYQAAQDLARDLGRYLADEPVEARPPSLAYRLGKFARKNRGLLAAVTALATVVVLATAAVWRTAQAERRQRLVAEARLGLACEVVNKVYGEVASKVLHNLPGKHETKKEFYVRALASFEKLAQEAPGDRNVRYNLADAHSNLHFLENEFGNLARSEEHLRHCQQLLERLVDEDPADRRSQLKLVWVYGTWADRIGRRFEATQEAERHWQLALGLVQSLAERYPGDDDILGRYSWILTAHGNWCRNVGEHQKAEVDLREAVRVNKKLRDRYPRGHPLSYLRLGWSLDHLGGLLQEQGRFREATKQYREAVKCDEQLRQEYTLDSPHWHEMLQIRCHLGQSLVDLNQPEEAEPLLRGALAEMEKLHRDFPTRVPVVWMYYAYLPLGQIAYSRGQLPEAEKCYRRCLEIAEQAKVQAYVAGICANCPVVSLREPGEALKRAEVAVREKEGHPPVWRVLAWARYRNGMWGEALGALRQVRQRWPAMGRRGDDLLLEALCQHRLGNRAESRTALREANAWRESHDGGGWPLRQLWQEEGATLEGK